MYNNETLLSISAEKAFAGATALLSRGATKQADALMLIAATLGHEDAHIRMSKMAHNRNGVEWLLQQARIHLEPKNGFNGSLAVAHYASALVKTTNSIGYVPRAFKASAAQILEKIESRITQPVATTVDGSFVTYPDGSRMHPALHAGFNHAIGQSGLQTGP